MIFVTVGTTAFNSLVRAIDQSGINDKIIIQKADGDYLPQKYEFFEFTDELDDYFEKAEVIVTHGGAGSLFKLMKAGKRIVAVANKERSDLHQSDILKKLSGEGLIIWCQNPEEIKKCVERAKNQEFKKYTPPECTIGKDIQEFLN